VAQRTVRARRALPGPGPVAAALAVALLALAVALGALALRGEPEPASVEVIGTERVAAGLATLAPGFGAVWTADTIRGEVLRIDPATRRVVARIPVRDEARVATGAGAVWAIAGDLQYGGDKGPVRLLRIDPATNAVVARIPMRTPAGARFAPVELQIDRGSVWAVGLDGALRIDSARNVADRYVPLAGKAGDPRGIVIDRDGVWVLTAAGRVRQHDARTGRVIRELRVDAPAALHLFWGPRGTLTLLTAKNELALIERASGRSLWRTEIGADIGAWRFDDGKLWVQYASPGASGAPAGGAEPDRLVRLDADTGRPSGQVALPEPGVAGMAKVGRDLWVATPGGTIVVVR
jgi:sugar lactone lactonase YvrE